jgi:hypothetical protein
MMSFKPLGRVGVIGINLLAMNWSTKATPDKKETYA